MAPRRSLRLVDPPGEPLPEPSTVEFEDEQASPYAVKNGVLSIEHPDGAVTIDFNPDLSDPDKEGDPNDFYANLANKIADDKLGEIANDLIEGYDRDLESRKEWLSMRERGIQLLGLK